MYGWCARDRYEGFVDCNKAFLIILCGYSLTFERFAWVVLVLW